MTSYMNAQSMKRSGNNSRKLGDVREQEDQYGMDFDLDQSESYNRNQKYKQSQDEQDDWAGNEEEEEDDWVGHEGGAAQTDSADDEDLEEGARSQRMIDSNHDGNQSSPIINKMSRVNSDGGMRNSENC